MKEIHDMCELENTSIFPIGDENSAFAQHFDGSSVLAAIRFDVKFNATGYDWKCYL